jgi:hypothetical protein
MLVSPVLCLTVLGGIVLENRRHTRREDAAPFHARARAALEAWPTTVGEEWTSRETKIPDAAIQLLHPNATVSRHYVNLKNNRQQADLLIVQCSDPIDMSGHYPPNCYPNSGEPLVYQAPRTWQVGAVTVSGMEYHFETGELGQSRQRCVYNFFILPGRGIVPDMQEVRKASGDYQRRYYGAAQFQLVFPTDLSMSMSQEARDEIFVTLIGADPGIFAVLDPGKI